MAQIRSQPLCAGEVGLGCLLGGQKHCERVVCGRWRVGFSRRKSAALSIVTLGLTSQFGRVMRNREYLAAVI